MTRISRKVQHLCNLERNGYLSGIATWTSFLMPFLSVFQVHVLSEQISWTGKQTGNWRSLSAAHNDYQQWGYGCITMLWISGSRQADWMSALLSLKANEVVWLWWKPNHWWRTGGTIWSWQQLPLTGGDTQHLRFKLGRWVFFFFCCHLMWSEN